MDLSNQIEPVARRRLEYIFHFTLHTFSIDAVDYLEKH